MAVLERNVILPLCAALLLAGCVSASDPAFVSTVGFASQNPSTDGLENVAAGQTVAPVPAPSPTGDAMVADGGQSPLPVTEPVAVNALAQGITQTAPAQAVSNLYSTPTAAQQAAVPAAPSPDRFGEKPSATAVAAASASAAATARETAPAVAAAVPTPAEQPAVQLAAVAPAPAKKGSLFSRLFVSEPKPPRSVPGAKPKSPRAQASIAPRSGTESALPGVSTSRNKLFGIGDGNGEDNENDVIQVASAAGLARLAPNGLRTQTDHVDVACLKPKLVRMLKSVEQHYGRPVVVTSGFRSPSYNRRVGGASGSKHTTCEAADIQVDGVSKWQLAKYLRSRPDRGGVGTYCHTDSVHVDIGTARDWNWRCRRRK